MDFDMLAPMPFKKIDSAGINKIFIGALFIFFDFRLNGFDIIPDFIGYFFVLSGLSMLREYSPLFKKADPFAVIALLLSFTDFYQVNHPIGEAPKWLLYYMPTVGLLELLVRIILFYCIIYGITDMARSTGNQELPARGDTIFKALFALGLFNYAMTVLLLWMGVFIISFAAALTIIIVVIAFIIQIAYLVFLRRAYNDLSNREMIHPNSGEAGHKTNKIAAAFVSCILALAITGAGCYFYVEKTYLFTMFDFPAVLSNQLQLNLSSFKKPAIITFMTWDDEGGFERREYENESNTNETAKQIIWKLSKAIENSPTNYANGNDNVFGDSSWFNSFFDDDYEDEWEDEYDEELADANYYKIAIDSPYTVINFDINDKGNVLLINGKKFILNEEDWVDLLSYTENLFLQISAASSII